MPTQVIAVVNQKGGVGKTTTSVNLAACLAALGERTLLVDLDSQANATSGLGMEKSPGGSLYHPLLGEGGIEEKIVATDFENLDLVPSETDLCGAEMELAGMDQRLHRLSRLLEGVRARGDYRVVIFDCPPSLALISINAFVAADWLIVPLQCEYFSLEGIASVTRVIQQIQESGSNPGLQILGIVMTMFDSRTKHANQVVGDVQEHFGEKVFRTRIPRTIRMAEAPSHGKPIVHYDRFSAGAAAYKALAGEVVERLAQSRSARKAGRAEREPDGGADSGAAAAAVPERAEWYCMLDAEMHGPITRSSLKALFSAGRIGKDSLVFLDGWSGWKTYGTADELDG